jgi:hypothetical protein
MNSLMNLKGLVEVRLAAGPCMDVSVLCYSFILENWPESNFISIVAEYLDGASADINSATCEES